MLVWSPTKSEDFTEKLMVEINFYPKDGLIKISKEEDVRLWRDISESFEEWLEWRICNSHGVDSEEL